MRRLLPLLLSAACVPLSKSGLMLDDDTESIVLVNERSDGAFYQARSRDDRLAFNAPRMSGAETLLVYQYPFSVEEAGLHRGGR